METKFTLIVEKLAIGKLPSTMLTTFTKSSTGLITSKSKVNFGKISEHIARTNMQTKAKVKIGIIIMFANWQLLKIG